MKKIILGVMTLVAISLSTISMASSTSSTKPNGQRSVMVGAVAGGMTSMKETGTPIGVAPGAMQGASVKGSEEPLD